MMPPQNYTITQNTIINTHSYSYRAVRKLGEGGFASVFQVERTTDKKMFALKILDLHRIMPPDYREIRLRFDNEYKCGIEIQSEQVVGMYDKGELASYPFFIMDYCPNGTLTNKVRKDSEVREIANIGYHILKGIEGLHKKGWIHRDLKPENIIFDENDCPKLIDFGISANLNNRTTRTNWQGAVSHVWGSLQYMPPEQFDTRSAFKYTGFYTDIFAFGVTMYEFISKGKFPFGDIQENPNQEDALKLYMQKVKQGDFQDIRTYYPNLPNNWVNIIHGSIQSNLKDRFRNIEEILNIANYTILVKESRPVISDIKPNSGEAVLRVIKGEEINKGYNLTQIFQDKHLITIGWEDKNNPQINDLKIRETTTQYISKRHATLELHSINKEQKWLIRDGQYYEKNGIKGWHLSSNGLQVNGNRISMQGMYLKSGDIITIGDTSLRLEIIAGLIPI